MTNFFATEETVTVYLDDDGHYVEIKRELDYGEEGELAGAAIRAGLDADGTPKMSFSLRDQRLLTIALYLVDWNITGGNGKVIPLPDAIDKRVELVGHLSARWGAKIAAKIEELRAENGDASAITLGEDAVTDPTAPGAGSAPGTLSPSPSGSAAPTVMSFARPTGS
jgi:hypothetical protein